MTLTEARKKWASVKDNEETRYRIQKSDDYILLGGVLFVLQKSGNVIAKRVEPSSFTMKDSIRAFRFWCMKNGVQYLRVEGTKKRYNFLKKMFPHTSILKAQSKERNIFYIKVF